MRFLKIYLASSWRNKHFENLLNALRIQGYDTYDFKHPENNELSGFSWEKVDKDFDKWTCRNFKENLRHPEAVKAFEKDFHAMLGRAIQRPQQPFAAPASMLKCLLGERASLLLDSQHIQPQHLLAQGFQFHYPTLSSYLPDLI